MTGSGQPSPPEGQLKRSLNLPLLVLYGLGTIVGAGIYALIGEVAAVAGYGAPLAFLVAAGVAALTAGAFAELSSRYPRAAGAALYVQKGFGRPRLALVVGVLVAVSGVVSAAALLNGFVGYLQAFMAWDRTLIIVGAAGVLGAIAAWGIAQSVTVAAIITLVEIGGLLAVIVVGADALTTLPDRWRDFMPAMDTWPGVLFGATLSFYAFIGFEDMVDVAEEVRDVRRTLPMAILITLVLATLVYVLLLMSALLTLTPEALAASQAPVAALWAHHTGRAPAELGLVAMLAIVNGALIQIVMASRVLYGLSRRGQLPAALGRVHRLTNTPLLATALVTLAVLALALAGRLAGLATTTSLLMLTIFGAANLALWRLKGREPAPDGVLTVPRILPLVGAAACAGLVAWKLIGYAG
ncbi:MAG: APC family permease [Pseudomonadota bacterium]